MVLQEVSLPAWPYESLNVILFAESAAAFEELTLSGQDDQIKVQVPNGVPRVALSLGSRFRAEPLRFPHFGVNTKKATL